MVKALKARLKFSKKGAMKFIGHLDTMRYFQKAFRRANIDVEYSKGFSPHQILSFAAPLGVGITSDGEYLDMQLNSCDSSDEMLKRINEVMAEGFMVTSFKLLSEDSKNSMSIVYAADYIVSLKDDFEKIDLSKIIPEFMNQDNILVLKKSKKSEKEIDILPFIFEMKYLNEREIFLQLKTGSNDNLKPELVMEALSEYINVPFNKFLIQVHRIEVYTNIGSEEKRELVTMESLGENI